MLKESLLKEINNFQKEIFSDYLDGELEEGKYEAIGFELDIVKDKVGEVDDVKLLGELTALKTMYIIMK